MNEINTFLRTSQDMNKGAMEVFIAKEMNAKEDKKMRK
jgi:hypothetical protein